MDKIRKNRKISMNEINNKTQINSEIISDDKNNTQFIICVRFRPFNQKELKHSNIPIIRVIQNNSMAIMENFDSKLDIKQSKPREKLFTFDHVFDKNVTQDYMYQTSIKNHISIVLEGYNLTVLAYGPTGAGKTYTMLGTGENPGIMPRSILDLFEYIERENSLDFKIVISYIEVYNETLRDLLTSSDDSINLRDDPKLGSIVVGAKTVIVTNTKEVFNLLLKGNKNRTTEATNANEESSRSHALLMISVENKDKNGKNSDIIVGKFILVDLAGSERSSNISDASRIIESGNINKSLLTLGSVINALVDQSLRKSKVFIPWRDSKLTRILKNSLCGNAQIIMIANVSPSILSLEETLNTLNFANRAKNIKTNLKINVIDNVNVSNFDQIIEGLKNDIEVLRHQLAVKTHNNLLNKKLDAYSNQLNKQEKLQNNIANHFQEEIKYFKEILENETKLDNLKRDLNEKQYELFNFEKGKLLKHGNEKQLNNIRKFNFEIDLVSNLLDEKNSIYKNEIKVKREDLKKKINKIFEKDSSSGKNLNLQFEYYCVLLENISLEHNKKMGLNEMKKRNFKINKLVNQIKLRDEIIQSANNEMKKRNINIEINDDVKELKDLEIDQSVILPLIVDKSTINNVEIKTKSEISNNPKNRSHLALPLINNYKISNSPISSNYLDSKKSLNYNNYSNPLINKPLKTFNTQTNNVIQMLKNNQVSNIKMSKINENYSNSKLLYLYNEPKKKLHYSPQNTKTNYYELNKINFSMDKSTDLSSKSFSIAERQVTNKAKKKLGNNFLSRYKNSPYI